MFPLPVLKGKKSFFFILFIIFLVLVTLLYMIGFGIYQWGRQMTTNEILQSLDSKSTFFMKTLESEIGRIRQLQFECLNDENLFYYVNASQIMNSYERTTALLALQARLKVMYNSSSYIENASVYIPHMNKMISAVYGVSEMTEEWIPILKAKADASEAGITYLDGEMYLSAGYPIIPADPESKPLYILIIKLSTLDIQDLLMSFNMYPEGGTILLNFRQEYQITVGTDVDIAPRIQEQAGHGERIHGTDFLSVNSSSQDYIVVGRSSAYLNMDLYTYVSEQLIYGNLRKYQTLFLLFTAVSLIAAAAFLISTNILINRPIKILIDSLKRVELGDRRIRIQSSGNYEFRYLYAAFNDMAASLDNMIEVNYQQKILTQRAELRQLQAQISPHFLYNSFFILYRMAKDEDYENITQLLMYLSEYYRYITRSQQMDVPLKDEVMHAYRYAQIQEMRFKNRITFDLNPLPQEYGSIPVPRLIIQPLLENALNHGLKDIAQDGKLCVSFTERNGTLHIQVDDNGVGMDESERVQLTQKMESAEDNRNSIGVANIHRRLRLKFGQEYGMRIINLECGGIRSEIVIPIRKNSSASSNTSSTQSHITQYS